MAKKKPQPKKQKRLAPWEKLDHKDFPNYVEYLRARNRLRPDFKANVLMHLSALRFLGCDIVVSPKGRVVLDTKLTEKDVDPDLVTRKVAKK